MRDIALLGVIALTLSFVAASAHAATLKNCTAGQFCPLGEGRATYVGEYGTSSLSGFHGRGAERGRSMYIDDEQDEAYRGRFP